MGAQAPKVLLLLEGRPLLAYVIDAVRQAGASRTVVVVGAGREQVVERFSGQGLEFAVQAEQKGTADAVLACRGLVADDEECIVVYGDVPLMSGRTVRRLVEARRETQADVAVLTAILDDPSGYGRIIRGPGDIIEQIVEERDADDRTRRIREVNSGFSAFVWGRMRAALEHVGPSPVSGEYYLTDAVREIRADGGRVAAVLMDDAREMLGANTPEQMEIVRKLVRRRARGES